MLVGCEGERREGREGEMAGESRWVRDEMKMKRLAHSTAIYWKAAASQLARQKRNWNKPGWNKK